MPEPQSVLVPGSPSDSAKLDFEAKVTASIEQLDFVAYYENNAGRLVVDPEEAKVEFGEEISKKLKLTADGTTVLWPQPADDPDDPQNWSDVRKGFQLFIITLAAIVPDFDNGIVPGSPSDSAKLDFEAKVTASIEQLDFVAYYENNAGRLVVDPEEAKVEFGEEISKKLKLTADGTTVLWPQPADDPDDPQNWSDVRKGFQLFIITLAAIVPDFDNGIGTAALFAIARQFKTTTGEINDLTLNWSIFLIGWGGIFAVMLIRRYGRLPVLFWSQTLSLAFLFGNTFSQDLPTFAAMRCLSGFFGATLQVTGLYVITDMFPFHLQARKLNIWTMGFIASPFLSPMAFGFLVARANWRWCYGIACMYGAVVLALIVLFGEETMYDRTLKDSRPYPLPKSWVRRRFELLIGIVGARMAKLRASWKDVSIIWVHLAWRPHVFGILLFEAMLFGFSIGTNATNNVFLSQSPPVGYGFDQIRIAGCYATPIVGVILGELLGRYINDWIMHLSIRRNSGVFEAESRLWACYIAVVFYTCGMILLGAGLQKHISIAAFIIGWGLVEIATMINTTVVYAYLNDSFPRFKA
ncbi:uncharacterized protein PHACADRAFT_197775 [Phanerochaete carnosa HHB-10118-sp]|uniref:Major facilitator superfamily (MFS) profile domain-containing protein n=1 Tax=Phanerochaete carnosa (strain HHB-10118-sp) TaxID=650164 RepID=K5W364_PHACS|nr:uncharacterized protein PHACADRAFT_197775 [Phanerochaete carnosa HHB-10118-sp]EKM53344.1 hypothetical protein PHACADRAFT_197775 [Phanerochaete carnosa HHB-10118-sp]